MSCATPALSEVVRRPERRFAGYAFDLDGTVYLGEQLLPEAGETIADIRAHGGRVVFVTNKPLSSAADYAAKLTRLGVPASREDVVTALDSLLRYLGDHHRRARLLVVAEPLVAETLTASGFTVVTDPAQAELVIVSFDRTFDYAKLEAAYRAVRHHGAAIVATNPDPYCPTPDGGLPDCAAMLAAIEACTGARAEAVLGKPSAAMGEALLERLGTSPQDAALVGDRLTTDVAMGQRVGMSGVLVLSGATSAESLADSDVRPDYVVEGIHRLLPDEPTDPGEE
jgi:HAD superfamily hydrolase (TIGR01450 family)